MFAKKNILIFISIIIAMIILYNISTIIGIFSIRGYVDSNVQKITAGVDAFVIKVNVHENQLVHKGQLLIQLNDTLYRENVEKLKAELTADLAEYTKLEKQLKDAQYVIDAAQKTMALAQVNMQRYQRLLTTNAVSVSQFQTYQLKYQTAYDQFQQDKIKLYNVQQQLKIQNTNIAKDKSGLAIQQYYLQQTSILAPATGYITNLTTYTGNYVKTGQTLFGMVDTHTWRVVALYHENDIKRIRPGQKVFINLSSDPFHVYTGKVDSIGRGISREDDDNASLPYNKPIMSWITNDYYFPVRIKLNEHTQKKIKFFLGSSAKTFIVLK